MKSDSFGIYGGKDPRDLSSYTLAEAARYLRLAPATLRSWVVGRQYPRGGDMAFFSPLIQPPDLSSAQLSFWNLVEAHVLKALRTKHGVSIKAVRNALDFAQEALGIDRLFLSRELYTDDQSLFLDKYGELLDLSKSGQLAMKIVLEAHLKRVEWDMQNVPIRLFPFSNISRSDTIPIREPKVIVIDPFISFGRPIIERKCISTATIVERYDAGESVKHLADDYDLNAWEIEAIIYERAA